MRRGEESTSRGESLSPSRSARNEELVPTINALSRTTIEGTAHLKSEYISSQTEDRNASHTPSISCDGYPSEETEDERLPLHEQERSEHRERKMSNSGDEHRLDAELDCRDSHSCEEEREGPLTELDSYDESECELQLLIRDEEEDTMRREWEETNRDDEQSRALAILDELQEIYDEEYPDQHLDEEATPELTTENFVEIDDEEEDEEGLDRLLRSNDSQMEDLVASCDRRDRDNQNSIPPTNKSPVLGRIANASACVVCLEAPRTHAYVPCGHFCVCFSCAKQQTKQPRSLAAASSCPVCQQPCTRIMRIFVP